MCGITGEICFGEIAIVSTIETLTKMSEPLNYRGPDAEGYFLENYSNSKVALAHKRLSIIDLDSRSNQPMQDDNSVIVFNGEIYNFKDLRAELEIKGQKFTTNSDTEVLLKGYKIWGIEILLEKIDGMFAFVLFDKLNQEVFIVRDRFGKKPLYYHYNSLRKSIMFSSDIRSFKNLGISLSIDLHALGYYFGELSTPEENSIYREIKKVKPGHYIFFAKEHFTIQKYYRLDYSKKQKFKDRNEILEITEDLLNKAVLKRMNSDVGISSFLSGGIDSSLVSAFLAKNSANPINTYSIGFNEEEFNELPFAKKVAQKYNTNHHEIILTPNDVSCIPKILEEFGEPFADSSAIPTWFVCNAVSKSERVVLSGDGGDEIFGGYYEYYHYDRVEKYNYLKYIYPLLKIGVKFSGHKNIRFSYELARDAQLKPHQYLHRNGMGFTSEELKLLNPNPEFYLAAENEHLKIWKENFREDGSLLENIMSASQHTRLVNDYLVKVDRASMHNSLEVRSPFLDKGLCEFACNLTNDQILNKGVPKSILKDVAKKYLPKEDIYRVKMGFGIPVGKWFEKELKNEFDSICEDSTGGIFNEISFAKLLKNHTLATRPSKNADKAWALYVFKKWAILNNHNH